MKNAQQAPPELKAREPSAFAFFSKPKLWFSTTSALIFLRVFFVDQPGAAVDALYAFALLGFGALFFKSHKKILAALIGLTALSTLVSIVFSVEPLESLFVFSTLASFVGALLIAHAANEYERMVFRIAMLCALVLNAGYALYQKFVYWPHLLANKSALSLPGNVVTRLEGGRPIGLSLSPDLCAGLSLIGLFLALHLLLQVLASPSPTTNSKSKVAPTLSVILVIASIIFLAALIVSKSAGVYVAGASSLAVFLIFVLQKKIHRMLAMVVPALLAIAFVLSGRGFSALAHSAGERLTNWQVALKVFYEFPLTGCGLGRFAPAYLALRPEDSNITRHAHSTLFQTLAENGLLGLVLLFLLVALIVVFVLNQQKASRDKTTRRLHALSIGLAAGLFVRMCIDYDFQIAQSATYFAFAFGLALPKQTMHSAPTKMRKVLVGGLSLLLLCLALLSQWRSFVLDENVSLASSATYLRAINTDEKVLSKHLFHLRRCRGLECSKLEAEAEVWAQKASKKTFYKTPIAHFLAHRAAARNDLSGALNEVKRALKSDPHNQNLKAEIASLEKTLNN